MVTATDYVIDQEQANTNPEDSNADSTFNKDADDTNKSGKQSSLTFSGHSSDRSKESLDQGDTSKQSDEDIGDITSKSGSFNIDLTIEMDATDMDADDLKKKLEIIEATTTNAEE